MGFQLDYLFIDEPGERFETGVAKFVGEMDEGDDELVELALRVPFIQSFVAVVVELFKDGQFAFTG